MIHSANGMSWDMPREPFLLLRGAVMGEDLGVAGIRCLRPENNRAEAGAAELFVHQGQFELAVALAAQFRPQVAGPQAAFLNLLLQRRTRR